MSKGKPRKRERSGDDPVPGERREAMARNVMDESTHDDQRYNEADGEPDRDEAESDARARHDLVPVLEDFERGRAEHGRNSKEEAEFRRGSALNSKAKCTHDRR